MKRFTTFALFILCVLWTQSAAVGHSRNGGKSLAAKTLQNRLATQPDFSGTLVLPVDETSFQFWVIAKKGKKRQWGSMLARTANPSKITTRNLMIQTEHGLFDIHQSNKTFEVYKFDFDLTGLVLWWRSLVRGVRFKNVRIENVSFGGHACERFTCETRWEGERYTFHFATDLKGLLIGLEMDDGKIKDVYELRDASIDVSDTIFQIPSDYRRARPSKKK